MTWKLIQGDAITELRKLGSETVHCCVWSPPYWNLRDYKVSGQIGLEETLEEYIEKLVDVFPMDAPIRRQLTAEWGTTEIEKVEMRGQIVVVD